MTSEARKIIAAARRLPETERQEVVAALAAETGGKKANRTKTLTNRRANGYNATMVTASTHPPKPAATIGRKIAKVREAKGFSQTELAARAGVSRASVNRLERGHSLLGEAQRRCIAAALEVEIDDLLAGV